MKQHDDRVMYRIETDLDSQSRKQASSQAEIHPNLKTQSSSEKQGQKAIPAREQARWEDDGGAVRESRTNQKNNPLR